MIVIFIAAGLWILDRLVRATSLLYHGINNTATLHPLPGGATRVILQKSPLGAKSGQHAYLWIPGVRYFETHPFTIVSTQPTEFVVDAHDGFTRDLHEYALKNPGVTLKASVHGPYGYIPNPEAYDKILIFAGGSGGTFGFGMALQFLRGLDTAAHRNITIVWAMRNPDLLEWFSPYLENIARAQGFNISINITGRSDLSERATSDQPPSPSRRSISEDRVEKVDTPVQSNTSGQDIILGIPILRGRPNVDEIVAQTLQGMSANTRVLFLACGPSGLLQDVRQSATSRMVPNEAAMTLHFEQFGCEPDLETLRVVDGEGAGVFNPGPFEVARAKAVPGSREGLLFISQDIFVNHWIANRVAPAFYVQETRTIDKIVDLLKNKYPHNRAKAGFYIPSSEISKPKVNTSRDNTYQKACAFVPSRKVIDKDGDNDPTESVRLDFNTKLKINYENLYYYGNSDDDSKRRLKFTITSKTFIGINIDRRLFISQFGTGLQAGFNMIAGAMGLEQEKADVMADYNWEAAIKSNLWMNYKFTFEVGTSPKNRGSFTVRNVKVHHLNDDNSLMSYKHRPSDEDAPGFWQQDDTYNWVSAWKFTFGGELRSADAIGQDIAIDGATRFKEAVADLVKSLGATVILPAGDVFMFKGLSCTPNNDVFTQLAYDTPMGGSVNLQEVKNVSWQGPKMPSK
nr:hypothetical protein FVER53263_01564 [Fusarium verticillioides]